MSGNAKNDKTKQSVKKPFVTGNAVNKQPWRIVLEEHAAHFYLLRSKGFGGGVLDMQKIDMGIALCHFDLAVQAVGLCPKLIEMDPGLRTNSGEEYIATYQF